MSPHPAVGLSASLGSNVTRSLLVLVWLLLLSCRKEPERGEAPPVVEEPKSDPCKGTSSSPVDGLPGRAAGLCMDPGSDIRRYGIGAPAPLSGVCVELFNGECELYKSYGLEGVKTVRYIAQDGSPTTVSVVVSSFRRSGGAFGFFTQRVLSGDLPSRATVTPLEVEGRAAFGVGMTVVWRGKHVVESTYVNENETPQEIEERSPRVLHPLTRLFAQTLVGPTEPERDVRFLEMDGLDRLGVFVMTDGLLYATGTGPGAMGYFSQAEHPHRVLIADRRDPEGTRDLLQLLRRSHSAATLKGRDIIRLRTTQPGGTPETWYLRRQDDVLLGVGPLGDESSELSTPEERKGADEEWERFAVRRLMEVSTRELKFE